MRNKNMILRIITLIMYCLQLNFVQAGERLPKVQEDIKSSAQKNSDIERLKAKFRNIIKADNDLAKTECCCDINWLLNNNKKLLEQSLRKKFNEYPLIRAVQVSYCCPGILKPVIEVEHSILQCDGFDPSLQQKRFLEAVKIAIEQENVGGVALLLSGTCGRAAVENDVKLLHSLVLKCARERIEHPVMGILKDFGKLAMNIKVVRKLLPPQWHTMKPISPRASMAKLLIEAGAPWPLAVESAQQTGCVCDSCVLIRRGKVEALKTVESGFESSKKIAQQINFSAVPDQDGILRVQEPEEGIDLVHDKDINAAILNPSIQEIQAVDASSSASSSSSTLSTSSSSSSSSSSSTSSSVSST